MKREQWLVVGVLILVIVVLTAMARPPALGPTTHGGQAAGLLSAYRYLEARGTPVERWQQELSELPAARGSLVIAAPLSTPWRDSDTKALRRWASQGGTVLILASGQEPTLEEAALLRSFDALSTLRRDGGPWTWPEWRDWRTEEVAARSPDPELRGTLVMRKETHGVSAPQGAEVLFADPEGQPMAWELAWGAGRVVVMANSSPFSNAGLAAGDNLALLEELVAGAGPVRFDERHHGHLSREQAELTGVLGPFELLLAHLALVYLLVLWATSRPLGPLLARVRDRQGSVARDLDVLASLHHRAGHAEEAGALLLRLARDLARRRGSHPELPERFDGDEAALVVLGQDLARLQAQGRL